MPRFTDNWVVDRTLFEFVSGGSCACCGFSHFLPGGVEGMISSISDFETDAAESEIAALDKSPWPPDLREQVWADRVRLRHKMKLEMRGYASQTQDFFTWIQGLDESSWKRALPVPRSQIMDIVRTHYGIHSAFGIVLCAVVEQVAHFSKTGYETDSVGNVEVAFEKSLLFDKRGGFTMNYEHKQILLDRIESLGGPKLLERKQKGEHENEEEEKDTTNKGEASFRSDRRIVRLLIARYWADTLRDMYLKENENQQDEQEEHRTEQEQELSNK